MGSYVLNGDGTVTYSYEVDNRSGGFEIAAWSLEFDFATPDWNPLSVFSGGGVTVPNANWDASLGLPVTGLSAQDFLSLDSSTDVGIGSSLAGFSFTSRFLPGQVAFNEFSAVGDSATGYTLGPVAPTAVSDGGDAGFLGLTALAALALVYRHAGCTGTRNSAADLR